MATRSPIATPSSPSSSNLPSNLESLTLESNTNFAPWLKLPDHLAENILERLPISAYVRFGGVCRHWRSIQLNHRCRHAPSPPPMLNLPWFVPSEPQQEPVDCFSPFEQRSHRIRLPLSRRYHEQGTESSGRSWRSYLPNGWLVLDDIPLYGSYYFTLLNPISGVQIELPGEGNGLYMGCKLTASPPPGCLVFFMTYDKWSMQIHLFREGDEDWSELEFPEKQMQYDGSLDETAAIVWKGKIYCMYLNRGLMVIDPHSSNPTVEFVEMDESPLVALRQGWEEDSAPAMELFMVESGGRMLLVLEFLDSESGSDGDRVMMGFHVFEADLSNKRWVRVESLDDRVLFIHQKFICSLLADDIGVEGNCIYCQDPSKMEESYHQNSSRVGPVPWFVFNLGTGKLTESPLPNAPTPYTHRMFVPSLC